MVRNNPVLFLILLIPIGWPVLFLWWLHCKNTRLTVTDARTTLRKGILSIATNEIRHADIRNLEVRQSFLQRRHGAGDLELSSAARGDGDIRIRGIASPDHVASIIRRHQGRR